MQFHRLGHLLDAEIDDVVQDFAFAAEVAVDGALADSGVGGDLGDGGGLVAVGGEDLEGGFDDLPAPPRRELGLRRAADALRDYFAAPPFAPTSLGP
nr:hypothetical protein [Nocardia concava]